MSTGVAAPDLAAPADPPRARVAGWRLVPLSWIAFIAGHVLLTAWDAAWVALRGEARDLACLDLRVWPCYVAIIVASAVASRELRGFWGSLLRVQFVVVQLVFAAALSLFVLEPLRIEFGPYRRGVCGDL